jgi:hypothetical protein
VITLDGRSKRYRWILILDPGVRGGHGREKTLLPVEDIGRHQVVFVGEVACFSLSARRFPCGRECGLLGARGFRFPPVGVRYLTDKNVDPAFQFSCAGHGNCDKGESQTKRILIGCLHAPTKDTGVPLKF